jgi:hypothetical protein
MTPLTTIYGLKNPDENFDKMFAIKVACDEAKMEYPKPLWEYFGYSEEDKHHLEDEFEEDLILRVGYVDIDSAITEEKDESQHEWQIDLLSLPKTVRFIRFENSY